MRRAVIYLRVSTIEQTTANQEHESCARSLVAWAAKASRYTGTTASAAPKEPRQTTRRSTNCAVVPARREFDIDAIAARNFGAQGIGLCRTEHMFFAGGRLPWVQQMIIYAPDRQEAAGARGAAADGTAGRGAARRGTAAGGPGRGGRRNWPGRRGSSTRRSGRSCRSSGTTSGASSRRWRACRSRSGPSIRRCTSSCPSGRS